MSVQAACRRPVEVQDEVDENETSSEMVDSAGATTKRENATTGILATKKEWSRQAGSNSTMTTTVTTDTMTGQEYLAAKQA
jgi:hypothetical protein